jgi:hypothetical protein
MHNKKNLPSLLEKKSDDGVMVDQCCFFSTVLSLIFWFAGEELIDATSSLFFLWFPVSFVLPYVVHSLLVFTFYWQWEPLLDAAFD